MKDTHIPRSRGVSRLHAHLVLTTKYRRKLITSEMLGFLKETLQSLCEKWQCDYVDCNGEGDHIHLLFRFYPQMQLSKFIGNVKSVSSRKVRQRFGEQLSKVWMKGSFWNDSYSIDACGAAPLDVLIGYVQNNQDAELLAASSRSLDKSA